MFITRLQVRRSADLNATRITIGTHRLQNVLQQLKRQTAQDFRRMPNGGTELQPLRRHGTERAGHLHLQEVTEHQQAPANTNVKQTTTGTLQLLLVLQQRSRGVVHRNQQTLHGMTTAQTANLPRHGTARRGCPQVTHQLTAKRPEPADMCVQQATSGAITSALQPRHRLHHAQVFQQTLSGIRLQA